jgi:hypothetical protein
MNATRRNTIQKAITLIEEAKDLLETARSDEQGYFDNMPESFQQVFEAIKATRQRRLSASSKRQLHASNPRLKMPVRQ